MREQSLQIQKVLSDAQVTQILLVSNLERYSLHESEELQVQIKEVLGLEPFFVANRVFEIPDNIESASNSFSAAQSDFLQMQSKIKSYQQEAKEIFRKNSQKLLSVPFYFLTLDQVLERNDEIRNLFE